MALGSPSALTTAVGADVIFISTQDRNGLAKKIHERFGEQVEILEDRLRMERRRPHEFVTDLVEAFPGEIDAVSFGKPTLEECIYASHWPTTRLRLLSLDLLSFEYCLDEWFSPHTHSGFVISYDSTDSVVASSAPSVRQSFLATTRFWPRRIISN